MAALCEPRGRGTPQRASRRLRTAQDHFGQLERGLRTGFRPQDRPKVSDARFDCFRGPQCDFASRHSADGCRGVAIDRPRGDAPARERAAKSPLGAPGIRLSAISTAACWAAGNGGFDFPDAGIAVVFWGVGSMFANIALAFGHGANKSCAGQEKCVREKRELQSAQNNNPKRTEKCLLENPAYQPICPPCSRAMFLLCSLRWMRGA
jgi:hypothetical protein